MAIVKTITCDLCGATVDKVALRVARVGLVDMRPEDCTRIDIGPECYGDNGAFVSALMRAFAYRKDDGG